MPNPKLDIFERSVGSHGHNGIDTPKVEFIDLDGIKDYRITFATATIANGTASVQSFSTGIARFGDFVLVSAPYELQRVLVEGYVSGSGTTTIMAHNQSSSTKTLNQGTWNIRIIKL